MTTAPATMAIMIDDDDDEDDGDDKDEDDNDDDGDGGDDEDEDEDDEDDDNGTDDNNDDDANDEGKTALMMRVKIRTIGDEGDGIAVEDSETFEMVELILRFRRVPRADESQI